MSETEEDNAVNENECTASPDKAVDSNDESLRDKVEDYKKKGNDEYSKKNFSNAIYFYTEGIKVNCNNDELQAKLYSNRAIAQAYLGNYEQSLSDAKVATELQPTYLRAIERGANACIHLNRFAEAMTWCDKGLEVDKNNKKLLELRMRCIKEQNKQRKVEKSQTSTTKSMAEEERAYRSLGDSCFSVGDFTKAKDFYHQCLKIATEMGEKALKGTAYGNLGSAFSHLGDFKNAVYYYDLQLKIAEELGDKPMERNAYFNLGSAFHRLRDFKTAIHHYNSYLKFSSKLEDRSRKVQIYDDLGSAFYSLGDFRKATESYNLCLKNAKEEEDRFSEKLTYRNLGSAFFSLGDFQRAIDNYKLVLEIGREVGDKSGEGIDYYNLGDCYYHLGDFKSAKDNYYLSVQIAKQVGHKSGEGRAYGGLGNAFFSIGDIKKAKDCYNLNLEIAKEVGDMSEEGFAYGNLANIFFRLGDFNNARDNYSLCLNIAKEVGDNFLEKRSYSDLGNTYFHLGDFKKARDNYSLSLKIAKEVGDKSGEGRAYGNLGDCYRHLGDFENAKDNYSLCLNIAKELGDKSEEGRAYGSLGDAFQSFGDYKKAIEYHNLHLKIAKEVEENYGQGAAYCGLGNAFERLGDFKKAIHYHNLHLENAKEVQDRYAQGKAYGNLGNAFCNIGDLQRAIENHEQRRIIATELGDKPGEGSAYSNLGTAFLLLGDVEKAIHYHNIHLEITKQVGDKSGEGKAYFNLGSALFRLGDFSKSIEYHNLHLKIAKELGEKFGEAQGYYGLGSSFEALDRLPEALECYELSVRSFNNVRRLLQFKDEWKISFRNEFHAAYTRLWIILLKQGHAVDALFSAEKGRAQALTDLIESQYGVQATQSTLDEQEQNESKLLSFIPSTTLFQALHNRYMCAWVLKTAEGSALEFRRKVLDDPIARVDITNFIQSLIKNAYKEIGVRSGVRCEDRSLPDTLRDDTPTKDETSGKESSKESGLRESSLRTLYNILIEPIADLVQGNELIIVPDGPLWLVPYAALLDHNLNHVGERFRTRLIPSLTILKLIVDCPQEHQSKSDACPLLVGDPCYEEVVKKKGKKRIPVLKQLPFARREVEMIGEILQVSPLTGKEATKDEVLKRLSSAALVHFATHGSLETGEIALTPDLNRASQIPKREDYMLTMADVLSVQLRARLVVLSCCHSGQGEIKVEGAVGIARAFMGAGARSVLMSLWAIDDEATMEFMTNFYRHLVKGESANQSLSKTMKCLRESDKYSDVKHWAPFVLVGDDVTLEFNERK